MKPVRRERDDKGEVTVIAVNDWDKESFLLHINFSFMLARNSFKEAREV
jgi:hypothetical protein